MSQVLKTCSQTSDSEILFNNDDSDDDYDEEEDPNQATRIQFVSAARWCVEAHRCGALVTPPALSPPSREAVTRLRKLVHANDTEYSCAYDDALIALCAHRERASETCALLQQWPFRIPGAAFEAMACANNIQVLHRALRNPVLVPPPASLRVAVWVAVALRRFVFARDLVATGGFSDIFRVQTSPWREDLAVAAAIDDAVFVRRASRPDFDVARKAHANELYAHFAMAYEEFLERPFVCALTPYNAPTGACE